MAFSLLSTTIFVVIYGAMQLPLGLLIKRFGLRNVLLVGSGLCAISCYLFAASNSFEAAMLARLLMGLGASTGFIGLLVAVLDWIPRRHTALFIGLSQFIGTMGPVFAAGPLESVIYALHLNWEQVFKELGFLGGCFFLAIFGCVHNRHVPNKQAKPYKSIKSSLKIMFASTQAWYIALYSGAVYFTIEYLSQNEGRLMLKLKGFSVQQASYLITLSWLGYAFGCPILGLISDYVGRRKGTMVVSALMALGAMVCIIYGHNKPLIALGFFMLGTGAAGLTIGFAIMSEQFTHENAPIGFALNNTMMAVFTAASAPLIASILSYSESIGGTGMQHYHQAFLVLVACAFVSVVLAMKFIKETFCRVQVK